jgi:hypothetical protein
VDLANDGVTRHPDLGGDLAASQSVDNKMSELFDALRRPSFNAHGNGLANEAAAFGRRQAKAARNGHRAGADPRIGRRIGEQRRATVDPAFTEPHPRRPDRNPASC